MLSPILLLQVAAAAPPPPPATADALSYDITLVPADTGTHILGEVQTTWRLRSGGAVTAQLDSSMRVVRVLVDGKPNTRLSRTLYGRSGVDVAVPHEKAAGDTLSTRIRYHGFARGGVVPGPTRGGERGAAGGGSPATARLWLPVPDDPDERAPVRWTVQAPIAARVLASGTLDSVDTLPYNHADWHYRLDRPIPIGRYAVAVGHYVTALRGDAACEGCPAVEVWSYPGDSAVAAAAFRRAGDIAAWLSGLLGRFPYDRLVHAEAGIADDAVSSAGMALYRQDAYAGAGPAELLIARETARQWLGIAVSPDSAPARRLFEGMPLYLAAMWRATAGGPTLADAMHAGMDSATAGPAEDAWRGAWTLHELRGVIGDSAFSAGLRALVEQRRDSTATLDQVALAMSRTAGSDAGWVLRQAEGEVPVVQWKAERRGPGYRLRLTAQTDSLRMPGLRLLVNGKRVRADLEHSVASVTVPGLRRPPAKVELDPAGTWLVRLQRAE